MAKKEFQAESKKLMDMMINSIYTNKEIFLRELISNASDAIDKLYYKSLTDTSVGMNKGDFRILITRDKENSILTVEDNGIGMTKEELEQNLGTIAHSGSLDFKKDNKDENIDIIGQFGVGFYSAFMVADKLHRQRQAAAPFLWQHSSVLTDRSPPERRAAVLRRRARSLAVPVLLPAGAATATKTRTRTIPLRFPEQVHCVFPYVKTTFQKMLLVQLM